MKAFRRGVLLAVLTAWVLFPFAGQAGAWINQGEENFQFRGGVFIPAFDVRLRVDSKNLGDGTEIDLQDDLDFDETETTFYVGGFWRFAPRHRITAAYFQFNQDANATLRKELIIGDEIFPIGARVESDFNMKIIPFSYSYSFLKREKLEFAASLGAHWFEVDFKIKSDVSLGMNDSDAKATASADAPLPMIGLECKYHFTPRWSAGILAQGLYLSSSSSTFSFSGGLLNLRLDTEYWIFNNVGLGGALTWFYLNADVEDDDWKGTFDYTYWGAQIYVLVRF
jgi:hypothetical protein